MIVDDASALTSVAGEVAVLRRSQLHGQAIVSRTRLVEGLLARALRADTCQKVLADRMREPQPTPPQFYAAITKLREWREALNDDLGSALDGNLFSSFQDAADEAIRESERRAQALWQRYGAQVTPETSGAILSALQADPAARSTVQRINGLAQSIDQLRQKTIPTADEIIEFNRAVADLRTAWSTLDVENLDQEIVEFLREANSDAGAALSLLTPVVLGWLQQRDALGHYVIRPTHQ